jgi:hypothetical protein
MSTVEEKDEPMDPRVPLFAGIILGMISHHQHAHTDCTVSYNDIRANLMPLVNKIYGVKEEK